MDMTLARASKTEFCKAAGQTASESTDKPGDMDKLPVEVLMHAEIDGGLTQFAGACRKFALVLDTSFALAHLRGRFQLPTDGMASFIKLGKRPRGAKSEKDENLGDHFPSHIPLPFAYQLALFILGSQVDMLGLYPYSVDTILRIVQSSHSTTSTNPFNAINWNLALKFLVDKQHAAAIEFVINNRLFVTSNDVLLQALTRAFDKGRADIVAVLLTCPFPLDDALASAVAHREVECVEVILNDPLQRVTRTGMDLEHGASRSALNTGLNAAISSGSSAIVYNSNEEAARLLLSDKRLSIATDDYAVVRTALTNKKISHSLFFWEVAKQSEDADALRFIDAFLNEAGALDSRRSIFDRIIMHCKGYDNS
ncbi:hypothetical protein BJ741DRAFT_699068 [Chytriomyces cf. hyalinus JEL632]|nr:hypothetical protein BJ741DRAFT_699068 [Chytriomyces cf. hyalinus JEL632]